MDKKKQCPFCLELKKKIEEDRKSYESKDRLAKLLKELLCTKDRKIREEIAPIEVDESKYKPLQENSILRDKIALLTSTISTLLKDKQEFLQKFNTCQLYIKDLEKGKEHLISANKQLDKCLKEAENELKKKESQIETLQRSNQTGRKKSRRRKVKAESPVDGFDTKDDILKRDLCESLLSGDQSHVKDEKSPASVESFATTNNSPVECISDESCPENEEVCVITDEYDSWSMEKVNTPNPQPESAVKPVTINNCDSSDIFNSSQLATPPESDCGSFDVSLVNDRSFISPIKDSGMDSSKNLSSRESPNRETKQSPIRHSTPNSKNIFADLNNTNQAKSSDAEILPSKIALTSKPKIGLFSQCIEESNFLMKAPISGFTTKSGLHVKIKPPKFQFGTTPSVVENELDGLSNRLENLKLNNVSKNANPKQDHLKFGGIAPVFFNSLNAKEKTINPQTILKCSNKFDPDMLKSSSFNSYRDNQVLRPCVSRPKSKSAISFSYTVEKSNSVKQELKITLDDPICALKKFKEFSSKVSSLDELLNSLGQICDKIQSEPCTKPTSCENIFLTPSNTKNETSFEADSRCLENLLDKTKEIGSSKTGNLFKPNEPFSDVIINTKGISSTSSLPAQPNIPHNSPLEIISEESSEDIRKSNVQPSKRVKVLRPKKLVSEETNSLPKIASNNNYPEESHSNLKETLDSACEKSSEQISSNLVEKSKGISLQNDLDTKDSNHQDVYTNDNNEAKNIHPIEPSNENRVSKHINPFLSVQRTSKGVKVLRPKRRLPEKSEETSKAVEESQSSPDRKIINKIDSNQTSVSPENLLDKRNSVSENQPIFKNPTVEESESSWDVSWGSHEDNQNFEELCDPIPQISNLNRAKTTSDNTESDPSNRISSTSNIQNDICIKNNSHKHVPKVLEEPENIETRKKSKHCGLFSSSSDEESEVESKANDVKKSSKKKHVKKAKDDCLLNSNKEKLSTSCEEPSKISPLNQAATVNSKDLNVCTKISSTCNHSENIRPKNERMISKEHIITHETSKNKGSKVSASKNVKVPERPEVDTSKTCEDFTKRPKRITRKNKSREVENLLDARSDEKHASNLKEKLDKPSNHNKTEAPESTQLIRDDHSENVNKKRSVYKSKNEDNMIMSEENTNIIPYSNIQKPDISQPNKLPEVATSKIDKLSNSPLKKSCLKAKLKGRTNFKTVLFVKAMDEDIPVMAETKTTTESPKGALEDFDLMMKDIRENYHPIDLLSPLHSPDLSEEDEISKANVVAVGEMSTTSLNLPKQDFGGRKDTFDPLIKDLALESNNDKLDIESANTSVSTGNTLESNEVDSCERSTYKTEEIPVVGPKDDNDKCDKSAMEPECLPKFVEKLPAIVENMDSNLDGTPINEFQEIPTSKKSKTKKGLIQSAYSLRNRRKSSKNKTDSRTDTATHTSANSISDPIEAIDPCAKLTPKGDDSPEYQLKMKSTVASSLAGVELLEAEFHEKSIEKPPQQEAFFNSIPSVALSTISQESSDQDATLSVKKEMMADSASIVEPIEAESHNKSIEKPPQPEVVSKSIPSVALTTISPESSDQDATLAVKKEMMADSRHDSASIVEPIEAESHDKSVEKPPQPEVVSESIPSIALTTISQESSDQDATLSHKKELMSDSASIVELMEADYPEKSIKKSPQPEAVSKCIPSVFAITTRNQESTDKEASMSVKKEDSLPVKKSPERKVGKVEHIIPSVCALRARNQRLSLLPDETDTSLPDEAEDLVIDEGFDTSDDSNCALSIDVCNENQMDASHDEIPQFSSKFYEEYKKLEDPNPEDLPAIPIGFYSNLDKSENCAEEREKLCDEKQEESLKRKLIVNDEPHQTAKIPRLNLETDGIECQGSALYSALKYLCNKALEESETPKPKLVSHNKKTLTSMKTTLKKYIEADDSLSMLETTVLHLKNRANPQLAKLIMDVLYEDPSIEMLSEKNDVFRLTPIQKKLLMLLTNIFQLKDDFLDIVLTKIEEDVGSFMADKNTLVEKRIAQAHIHTMICKKLGLISRSRTLIYDVLYARGIKAYPIVRKVVLLWPEVLPKCRSIEDCLLVRTIINVIIKVPCMYQMTDSALKKYGINSLRLTLQHKLGYSRDSTLDYDDLFVKIVDNILTKGSNTALILLCKCQGYKWSCAMIQKIIVPILKEEDERSEEKRAELILMIGTICRGFPHLEVTYFIISMIELFDKILNESSSLIIWEKTVEALSMLKKHNLTSVAKVLSSWKPPNKFLTFTSVSAIKRILNCKDIKYWNYFIDSYSSKE